MARRGTGCARALPRLVAFPRGSPMSGLAGIAVLSPLYPATALQRKFTPVLNRLAHRGSPFLCASPSDALAAFPVEWAEHPADALLEDPETGCVLLWDGRLDNRKELLRLLFDHSGQEHSDAAIVLAAWKKWHQRTPEKLLGDFAFVVWNRRARSLFAARDILGLRPFFYSLQEQQLAFASETRALLALPGIDPALDEVMVSEYLLWWSAHPHLERTFFRNLHRLPPGHWMRWDHSGLRLQRYWEIDPGKRTIFRKHDEYAQAFLHLLEEAVRCRLRGSQPVGLLLSGGFDSGAVACVAGKQRAAGTVISYTGRAAMADETPVAIEVARHAHIQHRTLELKRADFGPWLEGCIERQASPIADIGTGNDMLLCQAAREDGCRVVLTGDGADELLGSPINYVADLLRTLRIATVAKNLGAIARYNGYAPAQMLQAAARLLVPRPLVHVWKAIKWRRPPAWVAPSLAQRTRLIQRLRATPAKVDLGSISSTEDFLAFVRGRRVWMDESREVQAAHGGASFRFPFYDQRLLEFMFSIPWDVKNVAGRNKVFLRDAHQLLPPGLCEIPVKSGYTACWNEALSLPKQASTTLPLPPGARELDGLLNLDFVRGFLSGKASLPPDQAPVTFWGLQRFLLWFRHYPAASMNAWNQG